ncbi:MAG: hypothetical protein KAY37_05135 [Phycisphaerae bacterium]|nr:hypothetical protein [Phycisphaerae bacterium]
MRYVAYFGQGWILGLALASSAFAAAERLTVDYSFDCPAISAVTLGDRQYDRVTMPAVPNCGQVGEPALPAGGARILLPFGAEVASIEIVPSEKVSLGSGYLIEPVSRPAPLSSRFEPPRAPTPDPAIYGWDRAFPGVGFEEIGTQSFRGYQILTLKLQPVQYVPTSGELYYYPHLTVVVNTAATGRASTLYRGLETDRREVLARVDNPEAVDTYAVTGTRGARSYNLLILAAPSLIGPFGALKDYHDANGILTEIHTTSEAGGSNPDDVRNYIREQYLNNGIEYVIIGADDDIIPAKDLYVAAWDGGPQEYAMPADIYFACLDGTYNYDGDALWGEPTDGEGGGEVDLVAEVYVGRAAVGSNSEATRFVAKTIWYLTGQHLQPKNVLLVGEHLGFGGVAEYAGNVLDELIDGSDASGYTTVGIPSYPFEIVTLYERDWPWSLTDIVAHINGGTHVIDHLGHGNSEYAMKLFSSDILSRLTNEDLCFVYSQTCTAGHFDVMDCWAEHMNIKTDQGAFAVIMNARYGWGTYYTTDGPSQRFNREFWDAVYNPAENMPQIGRANQDSKEDNLYRIDESCMRWCTYELTLFGDPTVPIQGVTGLIVTPRETFDAEGPSGGPFVPSSMVYTVHNLGPEPIDYEVSPSHSWVTITNGSGSLDVDDTADVTVSLNAEAETFVDGHYENTLTFLNTTNYIGDTTRCAVLRIGTPQLAYSLTFDTDPGWVIEGQWAWGQPTGGGGQHGGPDPTSGYTGNNVYGYNLNGDYENGLSEQDLTSTYFDCTTLSDVHLKFRRWLGVGEPDADHAFVKISGDGLNWMTIWENTAEVADTSWVFQEFDISGVADYQERVYLRWTMGATDSHWRYCGWNIDDVEIWGLPSSGPTGACCYLSGICIVETEAECDGTWFGAGSDCLPNPCPLPSGACCDIDGGCTVKPNSDCRGIWLGPGTSCNPNLCPQPPGACCYPYGVCNVKTEEDCQSEGGVFQGGNTGCTPNPCPPPAVCSADSNCDAEIDWRDIDYFVAAMNDNVTAWESLFAPDTPVCPFENNDVNADGSVNWRDIDPLVELMNTTCP